MSYSLRDLPLPVKVVATVFLLAVGVGYSSAMLQLHIQDATSGQPMPTVEDVVLKFTGKVRYDPAAPPPVPVTDIEKLVTATDPVISSSSMAGAFTSEDRGPTKLNFEELKKLRGKEKVEAERRGEQAILALWIRSPEKERRAAYQADKFVPSADKMPKAFTPELLDDAGAVQIKTLIDARCVKCHGPKGQRKQTPLVTYDDFAQWLPPEPRVVNGWVTVAKPKAIKTLTQSTHAHLLSFATLFSLTGLIFAFTSYPVWLRAILGPWVVVAVFADVSMWWLARLCDAWGPFFAQAVIATGAAAGLGLGGQITFSLFNMYGWKGRGVLAALALAGALGGGLFVFQLLIPGMKQEKEAARTEAGNDAKGGGEKGEKAGPAKDDKRPEDTKADDKNVTANGGGMGTLAGAVGGAILDGMAPPKAPVVAAPRKPMNKLDRFLSWPPVDDEGTPIAPKEVKFTGGSKGNMAAAFFEKDKKYADFLKDASKSQEEKDKLKGHRQGDLDAMVAWARSPEPVRKSAYEANAFALAPSGGPSPTPELLKDGKVLIKTLIDNRCVTCHNENSSQAGGYPFDTYDGFADYLAPLNAAPAPEEKKDDPPPKEEAKKDEGKRDDPPPAKKGPDPALPAAPAPRPVGRDD